IMILVVLPEYVGSSAANYAKNLLRITVLLQYIPRMIRFIPLLSGGSATGFIFESAWANFVINILMFILAGHVVGSCWYLFGLQRVNQCLRDVCHYATDSSRRNCSMFLDCGHGERIGIFNQSTDWMVWINNENATDCLKGISAVNFTYGIYSYAVPVTMESSVITKYIYSVFWGFQEAPKFMKLGILGFKNMKNANINSTFPNIHSNMPNLTYKQFAPLGINELVAQTFKDQSSNWAAKSVKGSIQEEQIAQDEDDEERSTLAQQLSHEIIQCIVNHGDITRYVTSEIMSYTLLHIQICLEKNYELEDEICNLKYVIPWMQPCIYDHLVSDKWWQVLNHLTGTGARLLDHFSMFSLLCMALGQNEFGIA
ncbi:hypothetical protein KI387_034481, partial [Taxus chinensis]